MLNVWTYPGADGAAAADALPDLNEQSSSLVFPRLTAYQGGGKTPLWWANLGGRWPEAAPLSRPWTDEDRRQIKVRC